MNDVMVVKRRKTWEWQLRDQDGNPIMGGRERSRAAARYQGYRALFLLLASSWRFNDLLEPQHLKRHEQFRHPQ